MKRTTVIGAALALLMSSPALAQQPPAPGDPLVPPPLAAEEALGAVPEAGTLPDAVMDDAGEMRDARPMRARHGGRHWRDHHGSGHRGWRNDDQDSWRAARRGGDGGAFFRFRSENGPTIAIECADRDSTLECVNAIMPMLQRMLPDQGQPAGQ
jgi:hypothetical protein